MKKSANYFSTPIQPTWCAGCGNFALMLALRKTLTKLKLKPHEVVSTFDIGCAGNAASWHRMYTFHALHGRSLPVALGVKLANPSLTVIADAGDGGAYGEGGNHFLHACRSDIDVSLFVHNNQKYALTKGQPSPTSPEGFVSAASPHGHMEKPLDALQIAISAGATFVARSFAGDIGHLSEMMERAILHKGFSVLEILQPCVTASGEGSMEWYKKRIYHLNNRNAKNKEKALLKAVEWGKNIPIGILFEHNRKEGKKEKFSRKRDLVRDVKKKNIQKLLAQFS